MPRFRGARPLARANGRRDAGLAFAVRPVTKRKQPGIPTQPLIVGEASAQLVGRLRSRPMTADLDNQARSRPLFVGAKRGPR
jgi:hypothetical protein